MENPLNQSFRPLDFHVPVESETESETITDAGGKSAI